MIHQLEQSLILWAFLQHALEGNFDLVVTEPYGTEPQIPGIALRHPFRRALATLQVEMSFLSLSTASSLNNQSEESASLVVPERW